MNWEKGKKRRTTHYAPPQSWEAHYGWRKRDGLTPTSSLDFWLVYVTEYIKVLKWDWLTMKHQEWCKKDFIHGQEKLISTEFSLKWWWETKIMFGSHCMGQPCATYGYISKEQKWLPTASRREAPGWFSQLHPQSGSQDKNIYWIRIWNIRFWNFWLAKCQVTQSCAVELNESHHPSLCSGGISYL